MRIIAYKAETMPGNNYPTLIESTQQSIKMKSFEDVASFLLEPYEDTLLVCWDLDSLASLILRLIPDKSKLASLQRIRKCYIPPYNIFYIPEKVFSISHIPTRQRVSIYNLQQYYPELNEPDNVTEVQMLGENLLIELRKMGFNPTKLTSPVAIYEECIMSKMNLPQVKDMPLEAAAMAYHCSGRLWIEAHQLGYWDTVYDYDMSSAFPTVASNLVDFRYCNWVNSPDYQCKALYGYVRCVVNIDPDVMLSPIMHYTRGKLISPVGSWETFLTKHELDFITKYQIGSYQILDGWWAIPWFKKDLPKPLNTPIKSLLKYKQKTGLQTLLAKRMSTGIYGKFGEERKDTFGIHFNPAWFAEISTQTKLLVADYLYSLGIGSGNNPGYQSLIQIGVDGFMLTQALPDLMDGWRLEYTGEALVISSGLVYTRLTKPKGLTLNTILDMFQKHPRKQYYKKAIRRRINLGDSIARGNQWLIGEEADFYSSINFLNPDHDRFFAKMPHSGEHVLASTFQSQPILVKEGGDVPCPGLG